MPNPTPDELEALRSLDRLLAERRPVPGISGQRLLWRFVVAYVLFYALLVGLFLL